MSCGIIIVDKRLMIESLLHIVTILTNSSLWMDSTLKIPLSVSQKYQNPPYRTTCAGDWLPAAMEVLQNSNISVEWFAKLVLSALTKGRSKKNNIMIVGGTNSAKSFLFMSLVLFMPF